MGMEIEMDMDMDMEMNAVFGAMMKLCLKRSERDMKDSL